MDQIFQDDSKIKYFSQVQANLKALKPKSTDEEITEFINSIPSCLLATKDDLLVICQIISYYARTHKIQEKRNSIKIFEKLMTPIKEKLQDESSFFWSIFGGNYYLKLMFYEEGLIKFDQILLAIQNNFKSLSTEYFLPEVLENDQEFFEKKIKYRYNKPYSKEYIDQFKKLRKKYFEWIINCADYNDPSYREIEKNSLRLAIKTDDIESFQKILSNTNLSFNSKIRESTVENFLLYSNEIDLIEYATEFNSIKICKFLLMNGVEIREDLIHFSISSNNYEMIKLIESRKSENFGNIALYCSISLWNDEIVDYIMNNYDNFDYLEKSDVVIENQQFFYEIVRDTFCGYNFIFLESTLLPFFRNNPKFVDDNIYDIIDITLNEKSCFFFKEFLKHPKIDINYNYKDTNHTLLSKAVLSENSKAVEILLNYPNIDINAESYQKRSAFQCACAYIVEMKVIKLFCNHPGFDVNFKDPVDHETAFEMTPQSGFYKATEYICDNFPNLIVDDFLLLFSHALVNHNLLSLKVLLKYYFSKYKNKQKDELIKDVKEYLSDDPGFKDEFINDLSSIIDEIKGK